MSDSLNPSEFDAYADSYEQALQKGIGVSGESKEYFAQGRVAWLARCLGAIGIKPARVMDYGCGTGTATPYLRDTLGAVSILGVDISEKSITYARAHESGADFQLQKDVKPAADVDVVYCNGVFHHIPPAERSDATSPTSSSSRPCATSRCRSRWVTGSASWDTTAQASRRC